MTKRTFNCPKCNKVLKDGEGERCGACARKDLQDFTADIIKKAMDATPPPKPSGTMERAVELAVESTVLRHECNSSRMTLCKRGGDYEQCLKCWKDYSISKAQQEEK